MDGDEVENFVLTHFGMGRSVAYFHLIRLAARAPRQLPLEGKPIYDRDRTQKLVYWVQGRYAIGTNHVRSPWTWSRPCRPVPFHFMVG